MFGYIVVNQPELRFREFDRYHAYYCGLCRDLKEHFGVAGQITLSYDLTFLAMLLSGLYEPGEKASSIRCVIHPMKRHDCLRTEMTAYAAAMNIILAYHKARDDMQDDKKLRGGVMSGILNNSYQKAVHLYPEKAALTAEKLKEIRSLELSGTNDPDAVSGCFGDIMGTLFACRDDEWHDTLYRLGFFLGKFVCLLDAYDDIEEDLKRNNYNPLKNIWNNDNNTFDDTCEAMLRMMIAESARAFETLPVLRDAEILRNILYGGVWVRFAAVKEKRKKTNVGSV